MAKKSRKRRSQRRPAAPPRVAEAARPTAPANSERAPAARAADLAEEYRYVIGDLKKIGVLAASMFALLVVLALAAQYVF